MILRSLSVAVAVTLLAAVAAGAAPRWVAPVQISSGSRAIGPELAVSSSGEELVVWDQEVGSDCATSPASLSCIHIVEAATRAPGAQTWGVPLELDRPGVGSIPHGAVNAAGDAAIAWVHDIGTDRVLQATFRRGRGGTWPEPNDLSTAVREVRGPRTAVDRSGDAVAVWAERTDVTFAIDAEIRSAATGVWGAPLRLSSPVANGTGGPALALDGGDSAVVAWIEDGNVRLAEGGLRGWQTPVTLASGAQGDPQVAVDPAGDAVVVWTAGSSIESAFREAGNRWSSALQIGSAPNGAAATPQVAIDGNGNAVALWIGARVEAATLARGAARWSRPVNLSPSDAAARNPALGIDSTGNAVAMWEASSKLEASIHPAATTAWQLPQMVASDGASGPRVAMDSVGHAIAVWNEASGTDAAVMATELDGAGPVLGRVTVPRRARAHKRVTFAVQSAPWAAPLSGSPVWRFGDGKTATGQRVRHAYARAGRYVVSVTQADAAGGTSSATATIRITRARARGH